MTRPVSAALRHLPGIALSLALTAGAAAAQASGPSGTLTVGWRWDPGTMDAQMHRQRYTQIISHAMRDKFYYLPPPGLAVGPLLAAGLTQVDATTYDLAIRQGVKFHNGDELTSEDVVYTYARLFDPATASPRARMGNMGNIAAVTALDRYTVRFTTAVPFGPPDEAVIGLNFTAQEVLHKASTSTQTMDEARTAGPIGVGPFRFVEWLPDQRVVMEAFPDYWQGAPGVERIIWRTIPEEATRVAELLAGSVDMIHPVTPDFVGQLRAAGMTLEIVPGSAMRMLMMNVREGSPFADPEVRRAMNMAVDKRAITEFIYGGLALPFDQITGAGQDGYIEGYAPFSYDPEAARAVLSKVTKPIELFVQEQWQLAAEAIAEQLRGYGMNVITVVVDSATHNQINEAGTFDLMFGGAGYGTGEFVGAYYNNHFECVRLTNNRIRTGFCDPALDAKYAAARAEPDRAARLTLLHEIVRDLTEVHMPWVPLYGEAEVWAMQPRVKGFRGSSAGQFFDLHKVTLEP
ncbi:MAG: ABC transporter substrate-binding protein [Rhodobacteraceae bacterium]|nr:ABC transporter substrate-binding protein [Paracoccaceae bacterium]